MERSINHSDDRTVARVRKVFDDMPGRRPTTEQATRLWAMDDGTCERVLDTLLSAHFLERDPGGRYVRQGALSVPVAHDLY